MHGTIDDQGNGYGRETKAAPTPLISPHRRETGETYGAVVAILNSALRVIRGACGLQWIVQKRKSPLTWASFAYCATKEGLLLRLLRPRLRCGILGNHPGATRLFRNLSQF